jgi:hypothetical protein
MEPVFRVGQKVTVNIGGCAGNRTDGVIAAIRTHPELVTYEIQFPTALRDSGLETVYMAEYLTALT